MAQTLMPDIQQRLWAALPPGLEQMQTQQTVTQSFQHAAHPGLVLRRDGRPPDLDQKRPAVLWPYSIDLDGRWTSRDWCPRPESEDLEPRIVMPWDRATTWRPQAASLIAREEFWVRLERLL